MRFSRRVFRTLAYFKTGYGVYFVLLIGAINVLTSTYFLAIENVPFIKEIFPTFEIYVVTAVLAAIPIVTTTGYIHFKKIGAHSANVALQLQNNIYNYKLQPGFERDVFGPSYQMIMRCLLRRVCSEKFTKQDIEQIDHLRSQLKHLINGGAVGVYAKGVIDD